MLNTNSGSGSGSGLFLVVDVQSDILAVWVTQVSLHDFADFLNLLHLFVQEHLQKPVGDVSVARSTVFTVGSHLRLRYLVWRQESPKST